MKIGQSFNQLTLKEYIFYIDNYKKYTDFNPLGLYRSIIENNKLEISQKLELIEYSHTIFRNFFYFLQLKDPKTYFDIITLGQELTKADEKKVWDTIRFNQQKVLSDKKIKHRNFGSYSKHNCDYDNCYLNGVMIKQGSFLSEGNMHFESDKNPSSIKLKSERLKKEKHLILKKLEDE